MLALIPNNSAHPPCPPPLAFAPAACPHAPLHLGFSVCACCADRAAGSSPWCVSSSNSLRSLHCATSSGERRQRRGRGSTPPPRAREAVAHRSWRSVHGAGAHAKAAAGCSAWSEPQQTAAASSGDQVARGSSGHSSSACSRACRHHALCCFSRRQRSSRGSAPPTTACQALPHGFGRCAHGTGTHPTPARVCPSAALRGEQQWVCCKASCAGACARLPSHSTTASRPTSGTGTLPPSSLCSSGGSSRNYSSSSMARAGNSRSSWGEGEGRSCRGGY